MKPQLNIYNTLTQSIERFESIHPGKVNMYVCGPTVYDHIHIVNARPVIVFDTVKKILRSCVLRNNSDVIETTIHKTF